MIRPGTSYSDVTPDSALQRADGCRSLINSLRVEEQATSCRLVNGTSFQVPRFLAGFLQVGDEVEIPSAYRLQQPELRIWRNRKPRELYQAKIGYVAQPKQNKRGEWFL